MVTVEIVSGVQMVVWCRLRYSELKNGSVLRNLDIFWQSVACEVFFFYSNQ